MNYENKQQEEKKKNSKKNKTDNKQISDNRNLKSNRGRKKEKPIQGVVLKHYELLKATNHTLSRWGNGYKKGDITSCISTIYRRQKTIRKYSKWNIHSIEVQHYSKGNKHHLERNATR